MGPVVRALTIVERVATTLAAILMFVIMVVVAADVVMRYVFNSPLGWVYDLVSLYLMAGVFFLVLSSAYAAGAHVSVDILQQHFPKPLFRASEMVTTAASFVIFALIAVLGWDRTVDAYASGDVLAGAIPWPTWPATALVPFGAGLLAIRLALHFASHVAGGLTGREFMPSPHHGHGPREAFE